LSAARDHALIEELLSAEALGGLDAADRGLLDRERAAHGACQECARLETEFTEVAGRLALALDPLPVRAGMADDILRAAGAAGSPAATDLEPRPTPFRDTPVVPEERREPGRGGGAWRGLVAVAAAFVLFVAGWAVRGLVTDDAGETPTFVRFAGDAGMLAMAYRPGEPGAVFLGSGLPDPGAGNVYEIWMIHGKDAPISGGCVTPNDGEILTYVDADLGDTDTMAVTVEPSSCPTAPTTDPVLTASIA
jgi:anti-sigma-K factor RskA